MIAGQFKVVQTFNGGMGLVHSCLDTANDDFPVALKTFRPEFLSESSARDRFLREAMVWVDLGAHPNIVQAYKVFHWAEDQSVYIVMQLIPTPIGFPDPSLKAQLDAFSKFSIERSLRITLGIIQGMEHATKTIPSFVHRDLKPGNILIGADGQPKITDFGLVGIRPDIKGDPSIEKFDPYRRTLTLAGGMGTPLYMSPEQWVGKFVDHRSDIYSLGCILFEMLTNQFAAYGNSKEELLQAHLSGIPLNNLNQSSLGSSLKGLIGRCIAPNVQERFTSWQDLEKEVICILTTEYKVRIPEVKIPIDVSRFGQYQRAESLLAIGAGYINIGNYIDGQGYFKNAEKIAVQQDFPVILGLSMANQGVANSNQGYFEEAIALFQKAITIFQQVGEKSQICNHTGNIGNAYFGMHDYENAKLYLEKAFRLAEQLKDPLSQAFWMGNLGNVYVAKGDHQKALALFQEALKISQTTKSQSSVCKHIASIASAYEALGDLRRAEDNYRSSLSISQQIGDRQTEGGVLLAIGSLYCKQNRINEGITSLDLALKIGRETNDQYLIAKSLGNLATGYLLINQTKAAIPLIEEAIVISEKISAKDIYARACWSLGLIDEMSNNINSAISHLREAVIIFKSLNMPEYQQASNHLKQLRKALGLL